MQKLKNAFQTSRKYRGNSVKFFLPGMFNFYGDTGKYGAISLTETSCSLQCEHCKGNILKTMPATPEPQDLISLAQKLWDQGEIGILLSGGCDPEGRLPWEKFTSTIKEIKNTTGLLVSVHSGFATEKQAKLLKEADVDQALIDVIGDKTTLHKVYHLHGGLDFMKRALANLKNADLEIIPHIVCGIDYGQIKGELAALALTEAIDPALLVIVSLMKFKGGPMADVSLPEAEDVLEIILAARDLMPEVETSLGCARPKGSQKLEALALRAGINRIAIPSLKTIELAKELGLDVSFHKTCCSVDLQPSEASWQPDFG